MKKAIFFCIFYLPCCIRSFSTELGYQHFAPGEQLGWQVCP